MCEQNLQESEKLSFALCCVDKKITLVNKNK